MLPNRVIRDLLHVNGQTVKAVRDHMIGARAGDGRASFLVNARKNSQRDIILCRLLDLLEDRLEDETCTNALSITELTELIKRLEDTKAPKITNRNGHRALRGYPPIRTSCSSSAHSLKGKRTPTVGIRRLSVVSPVG